MRIPTVAFGAIALLATDLTHNAGANPSLATPAPDAGEVLNPVQIVPDGVQAIAPPETLIEQSWSPDTSEQSQRAIAFSPGLSSAAPRITFIEAIAPHDIMQRLPSGTCESPPDTPSEPPLVKGGETSDSNDPRSSEPPLVKGGQGGSKNKVGFEVEKGGSKKDDIAPDEPEPASTQLSRPPVPELPALGPADIYLPQPKPDINPPAAENKPYIWPTSGRLSSGFGWRGGRRHEGIDIAAPTGTPVVAAAAGVVVRSGWSSGGYGNVVEIRHADGSLTRYAHNSRLIVRVGQQVEQAQVISLMGSTGRSTGPHLHFEIRLPRRGAVNPLPFLPRRGGKS